MAHHTDGHSVLLGIISHALSITAHFNFTVQGRIACVPGCNREGLRMQPNNIAHSEADMPLNPIYLVNLAEVLRQQLDNVIQRCSDCNEATAYIALIPSALRPHTQLLLWLKAMFNAAAQHLASTRTRNHYSTPTLLPTAPPTHTHTRAMAC